MSSKKLGYASSQCIVKPKLAEQWFRQVALANRILEGEAQQVISFRESSSICFTKKRESSPWWFRCC